MRVLSCWRLGALSEGMGKRSRRFGLSPTIEVQLGPLASADSPMKETEWEEGGVYDQVMSQRFRLGGGSSF